MQRADLHICRCPDAHCSAAGCQSWCTKGKRPPSTYCKFIHCATCPACHHNATITGSDVEPSSPSITGSVAVVWLIPSGIEGRGNAWDGGGKGGNLSFWTNDSEWATYQVLWAEGHEGGGDI